jgi:mRNA interferase RelE/StbE
MKIEYRRDPQKALRGMQRAKAEDIFGALDRIAANPLARNNNIKSLKGVPNGYRVRVGDWRVSYTLNRAADVIDVFEIAPRGGAYQ